MVEPDRIQVQAPEHVTGAERAGTFGCNELDLRLGPIALIAIWLKHTDAERQRGQVNVFVVEVVEILDVSRALLRPGRIAKVVRQRDRGLKFRNKPALTRGEKMTSLLAFSRRLRPRAMFSL